MLSLDGKHGDSVRIFTVDRNVMFWAAVSPQSVELFIISVTISSLSNCMISWLIHLYSTTVPRVCSENTYIHCSPNESSMRGRVAQKADGDLQFVI
jgi:hypothetical protein